MFLCDKCEYYNNKRHCTNVYAAANVTVNSDAFEYCSTHDNYLCPYYLPAETLQQYDVINRPEHYTAGGIECIDAMAAALGIDAVKDFCVCNAFKYIWRHDHKGGNEDIKKSIWYLNKYLELNKTE